VPKKSGRSKRNAIDIEADLTDGYKALGFIQGFQATASTDRFITSVVEYAHNDMAKEFDREMDNAAASNSDAYSHVYEWRMTGLPQGRLWAHTLTGRGVNRQASWEWKPSKAPILTPQERKSGAGSSNDPIKNVPAEELARLSKRKYYFTWKAPMMEYGLPVTIVPVNAKALWIPVVNSKKGFIFAKMSQNQMPNTNAGRFTAYWTQWWTGGGAASVWQGSIKNIIEKDLGRAEREMRKGRKRNKTFTMSTFASNDAAYEAGRNYAEAYILGKAKSYKQASRYVDKNGKFGMDVNYPE
jgi:hypothetical protein